MYSIVHVYVYTKYGPWFKVCTCVQSNPRQYSETSEYNQTFGTLKLFCYIENFFKETHRSLTMILLDPNHPMYMCIIISCLTLYCVKRTMCIVYMYMCVCTCKYMYMCIVYMYMCIVYMYMCIVYMYMCIVYMYMCIVYMYMCIVYMYSVLCTCTLVHNYAHVKL